MGRFVSPIWVGFDEIGRLVGSKVGWCDGTADGCLEGFRLGWIDGLEVGDEDG